MKQSYFKIFFAIAAIILPCGLVFGALSYVPRVYLGGYAGSNLSGEAEILEPVFLRDDLNLFVYGQGRYGHQTESWQKNTWTGSLGLGYRQIMGNAVILGANFFGDYTQAIDGHDFWIIGPGIEALGKIWDFRLNGYIPSGKKRWKDQAWADAFGDYSQIIFQGHDQYNRLYIYYSETGPGVDAEIGRKLFKIKNTLVKGYLNAYSYIMQDNDDLIGGSARITIQPNNYLEFSLNYSYDNYQHSVFVAGVRVSLYDLFSKEYKNAPVDENDLQHRLFTPIERNLGAIGLGSTVPITTGKFESAGVKLERSNIWFFDGSSAATVPVSGAAFREGTYENPFSSSDFKQVTLDWLNIVAPGAYMYFSPGSYHSVNWTPAAIPVQLYPGQSMWGRKGGVKGFQEPATGDSRPLFIGALDLANNNTLDSIRLERDPAVNVVVMPYGVGLDGVNNVILNNLAIGANNAATGYLIAGILLDHSSSATITNSTVSGYVDPITPWIFAAGIAVENNSVLNVAGGTTVSGYNDAGFNAVGIFAYKGGIVNISGANNISGFAPALGGIGSGIRADQGSTVNIFGGSTITGIGAANAYGVWANNNSHINVNGVNTFVTHNTSNPASGNAYGIYLIGESTLGGNYSQSMFDVQGGANKGNIYSG